MPLEYPPPAPTAPELTAEDYAKVMHQRQVSLAATVAGLPQQAADIQANFLGAATRLDSADVAAFGMACYATFLADKASLLPALKAFLDKTAEGLTLPGAPVTGETLIGELLDLYGE